jgi:hypothetical protein
LKGSPEFVLRKPCVAFGGRTMTPRSLRFASPVGEHGGVKLERRRSFVPAGSALVGVAMSPLVLGGRGQAPMISRPVERGSWERFHNEKA